MYKQQQQVRGSDIPSLDELQAKAYNKPPENAQPYYPPPPPAPVAFPSEYNNIKNLMDDSDEDDKNKKQLPKKQQKSNPQSNKYPVIAPTLGSNQFANSRGNYSNEGSLSTGFQANQANIVDPLTVNYQNYNPYNQPSQEQYPVIPMQVQPQLAQVNYPQYQPQLGYPSQENLLGQQKGYVQSNPPLYAPGLEYDSGACIHQKTELINENDENTAQFYYYFGFKLLLVAMYILILLPCYIAMAIESLNRKPVLQKVKCLFCGKTINQTEINSSSTPQPPQMGLCVVLFILFFVIWAITKINFFMLNIYFVRDIIRMIASIFHPGKMD